jgi:hypothetical protein
MAQTTQTPWAAQGITLSRREEELAAFLLSRGKKDQLERLLAKARAGLSTGLTSPAAAGHAHAARFASSRPRPLAPHNRWRPTTDRRQSPARPRSRRRRRSPTRRDERTTRRL